MLERYASSTFNVGHHKPLQEIDGPPLEIHIESNVTLRVCHTPSQILIHWHNKVEEDIRRDETLVIIEKVPYGVPVT